MNNIWNLSFIHQFDKPNDLNVNLFIDEHHGYPFYNSFYSILLGNDLFILFSIIITIIPKNTLKNIDSHDYFTSPFSMIIDNLLILSLPDYWIDAMLFFLTLTQVCLHETDMRKSLFFVIHHLFVELQLEMYLLRFWWELRRLGGYLCILNTTELHYISSFIGWTIRTRYSS